MLEKFHIYLKVYILQCFLHIIIQFLIIIYIMIKFNVQICYKLRSLSLSFRQIFFLIIKLKIKSGVYNINRRLRITTEFTNFLDVVYNIWSTL